MNRSSRQSSSANSAANSSAKSSAKAAQDSSEKKARPAPTKKGAQTKQLKPEQKRQKAPAGLGTPVVEPLILSEIATEETINIAIGETTDEGDVIKPTSQGPEQSPGSSASTATPGEFEVVFARWKSSGDPALRDQLILMYRNLVVSLARRFLERGEMFDDIVQQGTIGLIYALDHFDPGRGVRFTTFATPAILGEIRRYFRDKSWGIRVPRRLQELHQLINRSIEQLTQQYDRAPTYAEIANALNVPEEDVIEVVEMAHAVDPMSLDEQTPSETGQMQSTLGDTLGEADANLQKWHDWAPLQAALASLPERQQQVMRGIYFEGRSQVEIARALNVSQMYVSRAQRRALAKLKEILHDEV